eukprot:404184-Rhodomonas_salina.1
MDTALANELGDERDESAHRGGDVFQQVPRLTYPTLLFYIASIGRPEHAYPSLFQTAVPASFQTTRVLGQTYQDVPFQAALLPLSP